MTLFFPINIIIYWLKNVYPNNHDTCHNKRYYTIQATIWERWFHLFLHFFCAAICCRLQNKLLNNLTINAFLSHGIDCIVIIYFHNHKILNPSVVHFNINRKYSLPPIHDLKRSKTSRLMNLCLIHSRHLSTHPTLLSCHRKPLPTYFVGFGHSPNKTKKDNLYTNLSTPACKCQNTIIIAYTVRAKNLRIAKTIMLQ